MKFFMRKFISFFYIIFLIIKTILLKVLGIKKEPISKIFEDIIIEHTTF